MTTQIPMEIIRERGEPMLCQPRILGFNGFHACCYGPCVGCAVATDCCWNCCHHGCGAGLCDDCLRGCQVACCGESTGWNVCGIPCVSQSCCHAARHFPRQEFATFYDFGSLFQKKRTKAEFEAFQEALKTMGVWYSHRATTTVILNVLPQQWDVAAYNQRGWTLFEERVSNLTKPQSDSTWLRVVKADKEHDDWHHAEGSSSYRPPPLHPKEFASRISRMVFTNGRTDCPLVAGLYAHTFSQVFGMALELEFSHCGWKDDEVKQVAGLLHLAAKVERLHIVNRFMSSDGYADLAEALQSETAAPALKELRVHDEGRESQRLRAVCAAIRIRLIFEVSTNLDHWFDPDDGKGTDL